MSAFFDSNFANDSNFAKAYGVYGQLWQSSSRRIKLCQSLRSLWVSFGKVHRVESNFAKACGVYGQLWQSSPGESNFAKACEVYGAALAKFPPANQTLPKLTEFMVSFGKVLPVDTEFAKVGGIDDSAWQTRLPSGPAIR